MLTGELTFFVNASPERTFDALADYPRFFRGQGITLSEVVRPGRTEPNGLGALREIHKRGLRFVEEITHFERPVRLDYLVVECTLPLRHEGGVITFTPRGAGTEIKWVTRFELRVPVMRRALTRVVRFLLLREFKRLLELAKADLEAG